MSFREYHIVYSAGIQTDHLIVQFQRLYRDGRDIMCDSMKPQWEPEDDFIIELRKVRTERTSEMHRENFMGLPSVLKVNRCKVKTLDTLTINTKSKREANYIWWLAKNGAGFDMIKEMHNVHKF